MGADLYIKGLSQRHYGFEVSKNAVSNGYFRDCYNGYGLFSRLSHNQDKNFSWWQTADRKELFYKNGNMKVSGAKILLAEIIEAKNKLDLNNLVESDCIGFDAKTGASIYTHSPMPEENKKDFLDHLDLFIEFLETAIKLKKAIEWSV